MNSPRYVGWLRRWLWLPLVLLGLAACEDTTTLGEELPTPEVSMQVYFTDTLTVQASTVLTDSVPSSATAYLLVGRYHDAALGTITGQGYGQTNLTTAFTPEATATYDSLVLQLTGSGSAYGDTTRTQQLRVHRLTQGFRTGQTYYTADALTYDAAVLGQRTFRARKALDTLRVRLTDALGRELWQAGQDRQLSTGDELRTRLPGLAFSPGPTDDAALARWNSSGAALLLYYHDPLDPGTALVQSFSVGGTYGHFYQLQADRTSTPLQPLTALRQRLSSTAANHQTYVQAGLGVRTKLEFPYLKQFSELGGTIVINSAQLQAEVVSNTESAQLAAPGVLTPHLTDRANNTLAGFLNSAGTTLTIPYVRAVSERTGLDQGSYTLNLTSYVQSVLRGDIANNGLLLGSETAASIERAVLGGPFPPLHPLKVRIYYTRVVL